MDMSMSMTSSSAPMPSSTGMSGMDGSSMGSSSSSSSMSEMTMTMSQMLMTFFTSSSTPLYSLSWTPRTTGQYAGTCVFLIALSVVFRGLIALRSNFEGLRRWFEGRNDGIVLRDQEDEDEWKERRGREREGKRWRVNEALVRAGLDTGLAGVSYLLMLAVMTMNVGYFISVLAGTFLGSFVLGGWAPAAAH